MSTTRYVWEKWNDVITKYGLHSDETQLDYGGNGTPSFPGSGRYKTYTFNESTGVATLSGEGTYDYYYSSSGGASLPAGGRFYQCAYGSYYDPDAGTGLWYARYTTYYAEGREWAKGTTFYGNYSSSSSNAQPDNGRNNSTGYWFVKKGSDNIDPASVTHDTTIVPGKLTITITPSTENLYGGVITYTVQTTTDGSTWETDGTTTDTAYTATVPKSASKFGVRVLAKDDTGFTSSTYVYGNGTETPYGVVHIDVTPPSGDIGYIANTQIMEIGTSTKEPYSFKASLNGTELVSIASTSAQTQEITLSDSQFSGLSADTPYTLIVEIGQNGGTISKNYTFRKFAYDDTTLSGVFNGTAKALREKLGVTDSILGSKFPEKVFDLPRLPSITATPDKVFSGYSFADNTGKIRVGSPNITTATADNIGRGLTAYNYLGELMTGTGSSQYVQAGSLQPTLENKTYTIPYDAAVSGKKPSCILAYFNTWVGDHAEAGRHPSFSPYFFRGAASGQLYGLTSAAGGTMLNQNQTAANTTISIGETSFSVTISKYDYVTGNEFCYILIW
nr:MAG TPA: hypothetical protein [Caudoviricetes sp.]